MGVDVDTGGACWNDCPDVEVDNDPACPSETTLSAAGLVDLKGVA
jgi:hypothetical protein